MNKVVLFFTYAAPNCNMNKVVLFFKFRCPALQYEQGSFILQVALPQAPKGGVKSGITDLFI